MENGIVISLDNHPRIIKFFGFVKDENEEQLMIIMEYLEGGFQSHKLADQKPVPNYSVYKYFVEFWRGRVSSPKKNIPH